MLGHYVNRGSNCGWGVTTSYYELNIPLNIGRHLLFAESEPVLTSIRGGGVFVRHYGDVRGSSALSVQ
jgi:hypothetical protein